MEWQEVKFEDVIEEISMGPFGSDIKRDCYCDEGLPYLNGSNVQNFKLGEDSFIFVPFEKAEKLKKSVAHRGDVIITHRGTLGQVVYIPSDSLYPEYLISNSQFRVKFDTSKVRPDYITYYLHSREGNHKIMENASQVGVPALGRPTTTFKQIKAPIPPLGYQNRVMDILSSLDRKIETNNKINARLEEMAQAIFKDWFVDFTPFKNGKFVDSELGMIPEGWRVGALTEIANYMNGLAMQKFPPECDAASLPVLKIKELGQGFCDTNSDRCSTDIKEEYKICNGDVIFSWSGTLLVDIWCGGKCGLNQHLFKVTSNNYPKWYYYYWTKYHLANFIRIAKDKAVTMGHIKRGHLDEALVAIPTENVMAKATGIISPLLDSIISKRIESTRLASLRDTLLPKLMSGEIEV